MYSGGFWHSICTWTKKLWTFNKIVMTKSIYCAILESIYCQYVGILMGNHGI